MKKLQIVSFDLFRAGESQKSLAIASILTYLKKQRNYGVDFSVGHIAINMLQGNNSLEAVMQQLEKVRWYDLDYVALSAYVWNEYLTNSVIQCLRKRFGFKGKIILGGYQVSYSSNLKEEYPDCQHFIDSYAEKSLHEIVSGRADHLEKLKFPVHFSDLPSPYLAEEIPVSYGQRMVRLETKRGCPYRCTFCAHRDLSTNKIHMHDLEKVFQELTFFKEKNVGKINILDPIFNAGKGHLEVLEEMHRIGLQSEISLQARFESIAGAKGKKFLDLVEKLDVTLEFGLQTAVEKESKIINRRNNLSKIEKVMAHLNDRKINYEISLIYGLPTQTLASFQSSIDFVRENGCDHLVAFPLMLLKGTELFDQKDTFGLVENAVGEFNIPVVTSSNSFSESDWWRMKGIAEDLEVVERIL